VQTTTVKRQLLETDTGLILADAIVLIFCAGLAQMDPRTRRYPINTPK